MDTKKAFDSIAYYSLLKIYDKIRACANCHMQMSLFAPSLFIFKTCGVQVYWLCAGLYWSLLAGLLHRLMATLMYGFENQTRSKRPIDAEKSRTIRSCLNPVFCTREVTLPWSYRNTYFIRYYTAILGVSRPLQIILPSIRTSVRLSFRPSVRSCSTSL